MNSNGRGVRRLKRAAARTSTLEMDAPPAAGDEEASAVRALFGARSVEAEHQLRREELGRAVRSTAVRHPWRTTARTSPYVPYVSAVRPVRLRV